MAQSTLCMERTESKRADQLQFLRFLAFLNVYIGHTEEWIFFSYPTTFCATASVGFFFMLSGLVAGYSAYGKEVTLSLREHSRYMWKKISKVYPLYFVTMLLAVMYSGIPNWIAAHDLGAAGDLPARLLKNLLMIQCWFNDDMSFNGAGWFLACLMFLYSLNMLATWLLNKIDKCRWRYILFAGAIGGLMFCITGYCYVTQELYMGYWHYMLPIARLPEYLIGMIVGFVIRGIDWKAEKNRILKLVFTAAEIAVLLYWIHCLTKPGNYWRHHIVSWMIPNLLLLGVYTMGKGWISELFKRKPLVRLGDVAFECYLVHGIIVKLYRLNTDIPLDSVMGKAFSFFYCLLMVLMLACLLNRPKKVKK